MPSNRGTGLRALVLDDDKYALEFLRALLTERYPELEVVGRLEPDPGGAFDLYFLDDDFEGIRLAGKLARKIRVKAPEAIVVAFSASLDANTLRELIAAGCHGVCDKKVPGDIPEMLDSLDRCMDELSAVRSAERSGGKHLFGTFRELFAEWNRRLDGQR